MKNKSKALPKRNKKGDIAHDSGQFDWERYRWWSYTHIFQQWDKEMKMNREYFNIQRHWEESLLKAKKDKNYFETSLFKSPDTPPYDFSIHYHNWMLHLYVTFFKEIFDIRAFVDGHIPQFEFFRIILPKSLYFEICNFINDFELLEIRDLIFHIIAKGQDISNGEVGFWNGEEQKRMVRNIGKESQKAIKLLDKVTDTSWMRNPKAKRPAELTHINFCFQDETIKITDPWICKDFIEEFQKKYNNRGYHDWRRELQRLPSQYDQYREIQRFKERFAKALYTFFTQSKIYQLDKKHRTPNQLMQIICKILEYSLIPVGSANTIEEDKIKLVRNWIKRNEVKEHISFEQVKPRKKLLYKYFDKSFIDSEADTKRADAIIDGVYLCERFEITHLIREVIHILSCLKAVGTWYGHQLDNLIIDGQGKVPLEITSFQKLFNTLKGKKSISSLSFTVEGEEQRYTLNERLPLFILEQALIYYRTDNEIEVQGDLIDRKVIVNPKTGVVSFQRTGDVNMPENRFFVRFVKSFYDFLLKEAPPSEKDFMPSDKYYLLIALALQKCVSIR